MHDLIVTKLTEIEKERHIKLLYVIESGSRAWGFPSTNSDYDVRGIFLNPYDNYLSVDEPKETFEWIENEWFDVGGWDLRKTLRLLRRSNSVLLEWLQSPITYKTYNNIQAELLELATHYYQPKAALYHYRGVAKTTGNNFANEPIRLKKWFYVVRSLIAAYWAVTESTIPPMQLEKLLVKLPSDTQQEIKELVIFKQDKDESFLWTPTKNLQQLIEWLWQVTDIQLPDYKVPDSELLNQWFRKVLNDINYR